jgi:uncharacterized protein YdaU (DUF1376 family)
MSEPQQTVAPILPPPLLPSDVDLSDYKFMPLHVERLRRSHSWRSVAKRNPELGFYMMNLWCSSWHERPAGSLEDDDISLADIAMCSPKKWAKVREKVLQGWVKCSDGRLYHPVVVEIALESWKKRERLSIRGKSGAEARWHQAIDKPNGEDATGMQEPLPKQCKGNALAMPNDGNREGKEEDKEDSGSSLREKPVAPTRDAKPVDPKKAMYDRGVKLLMEAGMKESGARSFIAGHAKEYGDPAMLGALDAAELNNPVEPTSFIVRCLQNSRRGQQMHARDPTKPESIAGFVPLPF